MAQSQAWGLAMDVVGDRPLAALGLSGAELRRLAWRPPRWGRARGPGLLHGEQSEQGGVLPQCLVARGGQQETANESQAAGRGLWERMVAEVCF